ncbi:MAG: sugar transferase [Paracoccaceae bacterium]|nr:sugar transferase [Paracoccaceae bacterium]
MRHEQFETAFPALAGDRASGETLLARLRRPGGVFDVAMAITGVLLTGVLAALLLLLNPLFNPGPVFYRQARMGAGGSVFHVWKFRTMRPGTGAVRAPDAPVERDRITPLGAILRITRLDEVPNFINVLTGEMRVIGPRPEAVHHAAAFLASVPGYADRFQVKPGITGLAQVRGGYAEGGRAVERKARFDRYYVRKGSAALDFYILWRTCRVMVTGFGAK